jgi:sugar O-acyltransferase (sialic acid O-acetyltransferase NeuD family)
MNKIDLVIAGLEIDVIGLVSTQPSKYNLLGYTDLVDRKVGLRYLGTDEKFLSKASNRCGIVIAIDKSSIRRRLVRLYQSYEFFFPNVIATDATLNGYDSSKGEGCIIQSAVYLSKGVKIGRFVKLNVGSKVFHDSKIGDFSTLAPGATVLGLCKVGSDCYLGANSIIRNGIALESEVTVGFGSVVTRSIARRKSIYLGNPARLQERNPE